jgi:hypothetical protein
MGTWAIVLAGLLGVTQADASLPRVGVEVAEVADVAPLEAAVLVDELARALERRARAEALVVGTPAAPCPIGSPRCTPVIPDLVEARVSVRLFGGLSMVRVEATVRGSEVRSTQGAADVPRDAELARAGLAELAERLFPERLVALDPPTTAVGITQGAHTLGPAPAPPAEARGTTWLWLGGGTAVALAAAGVAFGVSSGSARSDAETPGVDPLLFEPLADRAQAHGWAANVLFVSAAIGLAVGAVGYLSEP